MFFGISPLLRVVFFTAYLLPIRDEADFVFRVKLADAIVSVTDNEHEQNVLASIVRYESNYVERLSAPNCQCKKHECDGGRAKGSWQIIPYTRQEKGMLCISLEDDARIALGRIRESERACSMLPEQERLSVYTRGSCQNLEGRRLSRIRWQK